MKTTANKIINNIIIIVTTYTKAARRPAALPIIAPAANLEHRLRQQSVDRLQQTPRVC